MAEEGSKVAGDTTLTVDAPWWARGIVYQIYPRSYQDSNGDGVGDLAGILQRLDYLKDLGVDAIWISPIFPSPMKDFGYDIADYTDIHPLFGDLAAFDRLVAAIHERGMKILLDFVPNHTSDEHPWFQESRSSRDNPKRDWYVWHDPAPDGGVPNNWMSVFGGPAWKFDEATGQYYYHAFLEGQPDLNWRNPEVRRAMYDAMRFWLDRGVDGFRVDVIWHLIKDDQFRDNPENPDWKPEDGPYARVIPIYTTDRPEVHDVIREMRDVVDDYDERVLIGEIYLPVERLVAYYGADLKGTHLPFNFQLIEAEWHARQIDRMIREYEEAIPSGGWPNWVLGNHDKPRIGSRVGLPQARVAAMMLLTLRGTPTIYYGDEIGMTDVPIPPEKVQDPFEKQVPGLGFGRDPCRTPMQWDSGPNAGFSQAEPWLPLARNYETMNVAAEAHDDRSMLRLYRRLLQLRRRESALEIGDYLPVTAHGDVIAYRRRHGDREFLIALNLGPQPHRMILTEDMRHARVVLSTYLDREGEVIGDALDLRADEGVLMAL